MTAKIRRGLNLLAVILVLIPLVVLTALFAAVRFIDFNQYKPYIEQEVLAKTGHEFKIDGEIAVSLMPFKFSIGESRLMQAQAQPDTPPLLQFEKLNLRLSILDLLLKQQAHLQSIELIAPSLELQIAENGEPNWSRLLSRRSEQPRFVKVMADSQAWDQGLSWAQDWALQLNSVTIHEGRVNWQNHPHQAHYQIRDIQLMAFDVGFEQFFTLHAQGYIVDVKREQHNLFDVRTELKLAQRLDRLTLKDWRSDFQIGRGLELQPQSLRLLVKLQTLDWQKAPGLVSVTQGQFKIEQDEVRFNLQGDYTKQAWQGEVKIERFNPRRWLDAWQTDYPDFIQAKAITALSGAFSWQWSPRHWQLQQLDIQLDATKLDGYVHYQTEPQSYQFDLALGELNLDDYRARVTNDAAKTATQSDAETTASSGEQSASYLPLGIPVTTLREAQLQGQLSISQLQAFGAQYQNLTAGLNSEFGQLQLAPLDAGLYQGQLNSQLTINVNGDTPHYQLKGKMQGVQGQAWLTDLVGFDQLSGQLDSQFDLQTLGTNFEAMRAHLDGSFSLMLSKGAYHAIDLNQLLAGQPSQPGSQTRIEQASLDGDVVKGIYHLQNSYLDSERFQARLYGKVNLAQASLDNELRLRYHTPPPGLVALKDLTIPVKVKGPMAQPQWQVDLEKLLGPATLNKLMNLFK